MEGMMIFWLVLLILCIGVEVLTLGLTSIWFAGGALIAIFASLLYAPVFVQIILFFAVSLVLLFFTRPIAVRYFNRDRIKTNVESIVGRQAIVIGEIDNIRAAGQVTVNGQEWTARSFDDKVRIPEGMVVVVRAVNGVKLIVEPQPGVPEDRETERNGIKAAECPEEGKIAAEADASGEGNREAPESEGHPEEG